MSTDTDQKTAKTEENLETLISLAEAHRRRLLIAAKYLTGLMQEMDGYKREYDRILKDFRADNHPAPEEQA